MRKGFEWIRLDLITYLISVGRESRDTLLHLTRKPSRTKSFSFDCEEMRPLSCSSSFKLISMFSAPTITLELGPLINPY